MQRNAFRKSNLIFDPYLGSGTTAIASHNLNREFIGCELDTEYYEKAIQRIKNHTAQQSLF